MGVLTTCGKNKNVNIFSGGVLDKAKYIRTINKEHCTMHHPVHTKDIRYGARC